MPSSGILALKELFHYHNHLAMKLLRWSERIRVFLKLVKWLTTTRCCRCMNYFQIGSVCTSQVWNPTLWRSSHRELPGNSDFSVQLECSINSGQSLCPSSGFASFRLPSLHVVRRLESGLNTAQTLNDFSSYDDVSTSTASCLSAVSVGGKSDASWYVESHKAGAESRNGQRPEKGQIQQNFLQSFLWSTASLKIYLSSTILRLWGVCRWLSAVRSPVLTEQSRTAGVVVKAVLGHRRTT